METRGCLRQFGAGEVNSRRGIMYTASGRLMMPANQFEYRAQKRTEGSTTKRPGGRRAIKCAYVLMALAGLLRAIPANSQSATGQEEVRRLTADSPIAREMAAGETHRYGLSASAGEFVRVIIELKVTNATMALVAP